MKVVAPWSHSALIQQILANLVPSDTPQFSEIDMLFSPRDQELLRQQVNIFNALEAGETVHREMLHEKGD